MTFKSRSLVARPSVGQPSLSKRTLIRAFESHIVAKECEENGRDDVQAPMTLLRNEDGSPRKVVIATTDRAFAEALHEAIKQRVPVGVQLHRMPTDDELEELSKELPDWQPRVLAPAARSRGDDPAPRVRVLARRETDAGPPRQDASRRDGGPRRRPRRDNEDAEE